MGKQSLVLKKIHTTYYLLLTTLFLSLVGLSLGIYHLILPKLATPKVYAQNTLGPKTGIRWIDTQADSQELRDKPIVRKDAYSTHFKNPDGTVTALFTGFKQNVEVSPGVWEPIDYSLEKSSDPRYDYQTKNGVGIYLSKNGSLSQKGLIEVGPPALGLYNPISNNFKQLKNLDNPKVLKDEVNNSLVLDGKDVKLIVYAYDTGVREDLILENSSLVDSASYNDLLTLKAPITTTGNLTLNEQSPNTKYELTAEDALVLTDNDQTINFPFPQGHDSKDNPAAIRRFLIKEGDVWYLYTSVPANWLKKLSTVYPVTIDPDFTGNNADKHIRGISNVNYNTAHTTSNDQDTTSVTTRIGQLENNGYDTIFRNYLQFVTGSIPDSAVINQVNLNLVATTDSSTAQNFNVRIHDYDWSSGTREQQYDGCLASAYDNLWRNTSGMSINTTYTSSNLSTSWASVTGTTYYCLISSRDLAGNDPPAATDEFIRIAHNENTTASYRPVLTVTYQPAQVTASAATDVTNTSFSANWVSQSASGADGYTLDVATDSGFTSFVATGCGGGSCNAKAVGNVVTYSVTGLTGNTTYYYRVRATDSVGGGTGTNSSTITVTTAPAAPTVNPGVAVDSASSSAGSNVASLTWSHTVSGSNRLLIVGVTMRAFTTISSVTYAGEALTKSGAVQAASGDYARTEIWYKVNPATGTNNIVVTPGANDWIQAGAVSFTGVYQTAPLGPFASNSALSGTTSTVTVPSAAGDIVLDVLKFWNNSGESTKNASQTQQWYLWSDGAHKGGSSTKAGATGAVTMSWSRTDNNNWAHAGVSVKSYQSSVTNNGFSANWSGSTGATGYKLDVSTVSDFTSYVTGFADLDVGNVTAYSVPNLSCGASTYYYRVRASNASGNSSSSSTITVNTSPTICQSATSGNVSTVCSCSFTDSIDGLDAGDLTVGTNTTMTINAGKTFVWPPSKNITVNGNIVINNTGNLKQGYIVFTDSDGDGYPANITPAFSSTTPSGATRQRSALNSYSTADCNDNDNATQGC